MSSIGGFGRQGTDGGPRLLFEVVESEVARSHDASKFTMSYDVVAIQMSIALRSRETHALHAGDGLLDLEEKNIKRKAHSYSSSPSSKKYT